MAQHSNEINASVPPSFIFWLLEEVLALLASFSPMKTLFRSLDFLTAESNQISSLFGG